MGERLFLIGQTGLFFTFQGIKWRRKRQSKSLFPRRDGIFEERMETAEVSLFGLEQTLLIGNAEEREARKRAPP